MIDDRTMPLPLLIADAPPTWLAALYGAIPTAIIAVLSYGLTRQGKRADEEAARDQRKREGDSAVEIANIQSLQDLMKLRTEDNRQLREEIAAVRNHGDQVAREHDRKLNILTTAYYQLHSVTVLLQQGWRTMRSRLKKTDPNFDEAEFPDLSIERLDPLKLFAQMDRTTNVTVVSSPSDPSKTTTVTTEGPRDDAHP